MEQGLGSEFSILAVGEVDTEGSSVELGAIQVVDGILSALLVSVLTEPESFRAVGLTIVDQAKNRGYPRKIM